MLRNKAGGATVMQANAFGSQSGTQDNASVQFTFDKIRPGVYKVKPNAPMHPGEYGFLSSQTGGAFARRGNRKQGFRLRNYSGGITQDTFAIPYSRSSVMRHRERPNLFGVFSVSLRDPYLRLAGGMIPFMRR